MISALFTISPLVAFIRVRIPPPSPFILTFEEYAVVARNFLGDGLFAVQSQIIHERARERERERERERGREGERESHIYFTKEKPHLSDKYTNGIKRAGRERDDKCFLSLR
jgi:hypothetical protein